MVRKKVARKIITITVKYSELPLSIFGNPKCTFDLSARKVKCKNDTSTTIFEREVIMIFFKHFKSELKITLSNKSGHSLIRFSIIC